MTSIAFLIGFWLLFANITALILFWPALFNSDDLFCHHASVIRDRYPELDDQLVITMGRWRIAASFFPAIVFCWFAWPWVAVRIWLAGRDRV